MPYGTVRPATRREGKQEEHENSTIHSFTHNFDATLSVRNAAKMQLSSMFINNKMQM
jgi:hypothetical protein